MTTPRIRPVVPQADAARPGDTELVDATLAGDRRRFRELYARYLEMVSARMTRLVGLVPERDDLIQQVFIDVYQALPRFRGEARFSTFLHRISVNVAFDHLRRRGRHRGRQLPLDDEQLERLVDPAATPEARVAQREQLSRVFEHLAMLKPKQRIAFVLVAVEGMPLAEAAALVDATADAVKQRVLEARRQLADRLARATKTEGSRGAP